MANWTGVITNVGSTLLAQWVQGETLTITSAYAGSGTVPLESLMAQTDLKSRKQQMSIISSVTVTGGRKIKLQITAPETGYSLNQIGIFAKIGSATPVLLAIYQISTAIDIPNKSDAPDFVYSFYAILEISTEGTLQLTIDTQALVTESTMEEYVVDFVENNTVNFSENAPTHTEAEKFIARQSIDAIGVDAVSNRNLLDNPFFTINQREESPYYADGYTVDRWYIGWVGIDDYVEVVDNGLMLYGAPDSAFRFVQIVDINPDDIMGETFTLSALCIDGIHSVTGTINIDPFQMRCNLSDNSIMYLWKATPTVLRVVVECHDIDGLYLRAIKLEKGPTSTLANDTVPNNEEELIRCITSHVDNNDDYANKKIATEDKLSHRNLLDNGWFNVDQMGKMPSASSASGLFIDRWTKTRLSASRAADGGISVAFDSASFPGKTNGVFYERSDDVSVCGKTVTFSALVDNTIRSWTAVMPEIPSVSVGMNEILSGIMSVGGKKFQFGLQTHNNTTKGLFVQFTINVMSTQQLTFKALKVEIGSVSTLANDVAPNHAEELLKCQRYLWRIGGNGIPIMMMAAYNATDQYGVIQLPVTMRRIPTVAESAISTFSILGAGTSHAITNMSAQLQNPQTAEIHTKASGLSANTACWLRTTSAGGYIEFSAEL